MLSVNGWGGLWLDPAWQVVGTFRALDVLLSR